MKNYLRLVRLAFWSLVVLTTVLSLLPSERIPPSFVFWDKAQHALGFMALALLGLIGYPVAALRVLTGLLFFGAAIEVAQSVSGWRYGDWMDWLADAVGVGLGYGAWVIAGRLLANTSHPLCSKNEN